MLLKIHLLFLKMIMKLMKKKIIIQYKMTFTIRKINSRNNNKVKIIQ